MCNGLNEPVNPGRCNGKCTDKAHRSAYQKARKVFFKGLKNPHTLPADPAPSTPAAGDTDTLQILAELKVLVTAAAQGRSALPEDATPWEAIEHEKLEAAQAKLFREYGSLDNALVALLDETGALVAARAQELAGKSLADMQQGAEQRVAMAHRAWRDHRSIYGTEATPRSEILRRCVNAVSNGTDPESMADHRLLADSYLAALSEVRSMGGVLILDPDSEPVAAAALQEGSAFFPSDWADLSNAGRALYAGTSDDGAGGYRIVGNAPVRAQRQDMMHFPSGSTPGTTAHGEWAATGEKTAGGLEVFTRAKWEVAPDGFKIPGAGKPGANLHWQEWEHPETGAVSVRRPVMDPAKITKDASYIKVGSGQPPGAAGLGHYTAVAIHEQAHRYEEVQPLIRKMESAFLVSRTTLADGSREELQEMGIGGHPNMVRPDHFAHMYSGREPYAGGYTEVLATGVQGLFGGQLGGHVGLSGGFREDLGMRNFVLGVMATA